MQEPFFQTPNGKLIHELIHEHVHVLQILGFVIKDLEYEAKEGTGLYSKDQLESNTNLLKKAKKRAIDSMDKFYVEFKKIKQ